MSDTNVVIPPMPENYWPNIVVVGKDGNLELGFVITEAGKDFVKESIQPSLDGLRRCLWQAKFMPSDEYKKTCFSAPKETT